MIQKTKHELRQELRAADRRSECLFTLKGTIKSGGVPDNCGINKIAKKSGTS